MWQRIDWSRLRELNEHQEGDTFHSVLGVKKALVGYCDTKVPVEGVEQTLRKLSVLSKADREQRLSENRDVAAKIASEALDDNEERQCRVWNAGNIWLLYLKGSTDDVYEMELLILLDSAYTTVVGTVTSHPIVVTDTFYTDNSDGSGPDMVRDFLFGQSQVSYSTELDESKLSVSVYISAMFKYSHEYMLNMYH